MEKFRNPALSFDERVRDLISRLTTEEKIGLLSTAQQPIERLSVGEWFIGAEVARGYVSRDPDEPTTVFPQPIGLAGTFDTELMYRLGRIAGTEARILNGRHKNGHLMLWGPTVDMCRNPLWGRNEEAYGEDPYLTGQMSAAYTNGLADKRGGYMQTIPTLKHFCANNNEVDRDKSNSNLEPRTKHEYYYAAFKPAVCEGSAYSVMAAYNELSGVPCVINPELKSILKKQWGLGFVVTDGGDFTQNVVSHNYGTSHAQTLALALKNGTDAMTDSRGIVAAAAREALETGLITEKDIDDTIYNTLLARFMLGEFDEKHPYSDIDPALMDCENSRRENLLAAKEQTVLLKKGGVLPLSPDKKIALIGLNGNACLKDWYTGYSSYETTIADGLKEKFAVVAQDNGCDIVAIKSKLTGKYLGADENGVISADYEKTDREAEFIKAEYGHGEMTLLSVKCRKYFTESSCKADSEGTYRWFSQEILKPRTIDGYTEYQTYFKGAVEVGEDGVLRIGRLFGITDAKLFSEEIISSGTQRAAELAKNADAVIVCVGNDPMTVAREMYDRTTLALPEHQKALLRAAYDANKNTVAAVVSSYPYAICEEQTYIPDIIYTTHAGPELGHAFAAVVTGEYNPAGRLAQTWYKSEYELPPITEYDIIDNDMTYLYYKGKPLYPFGHGLSYSEFSYSGFEVCCAGDKIKASLDVRNTSDISGDEVVQIYFRPEKPRVKRPIRQLCAFERKRVNAGETVRFEFEIDKSRLEFYDVTREKFCVESGMYSFFAGASCEDIRCNAQVLIAGEEIPKRSFKQSTKAINYDRKYGTRMMYSRAGEFHYMKGGTLLFDNCDIRGATKIELTAGNIGDAAEAEIKADGKTLAKVKIPPLTDTERFVPITQELDAFDGDGGNVTLEISLPGFTALSEFRLI